MAGRHEKHTLRKSHRKTSEDQTKEAVFLCQQRNNSRTTAPYLPTVNLSTAGLFEQVSDQTAVKTQLNHSSIQTVRWHNTLSYPEEGQVTVLLHVRDLQVLQHHGTVAVGLHHVQVVVVSGAEKV